MDISRWMRGSPRPPVPPELAVPQPDERPATPFAQGASQSAWSNGGPDPIVESQVNAEPEMGIELEPWPEAEAVEVQRVLEPDEALEPERAPEPGLAVPTPPPATAAAGTSRSTGRAYDSWTVDAGVAVVQPRSAAEVLSTLAQKVSSGAVEQYQPVPLGFTPLDKTIGGGLRAGELLLIGGAQGTGKTTMAVQMARNIVLGGQASVLYICFEHDEEYLLNRIIAMESVLSHLPQKTNGVKLQDVRREILGTWLAQGSEEADLSANPTPAARSGTDRALRPEPVHAARLADPQHHREHACARAALQATIGR